MTLTLSVINFDLDLEITSTYESTLVEYKPVAEPGFSRGGCANLGGAPTYYLTNFSQKLHENEEILAQTGASVPRAP